MNAALLLLWRRALTCYDPRERCYYKSESTCDFLNVKRCCTVEKKPKLVPIPSCAEEEEPLEHLEAPSMQ